MLKSEYVANDARISYEKVTKRKAKSNNKI